MKIVSALLLALCAGSATANLVVEQAQYGGSHTIAFTPGQYDQREVPTLAYSSVNFATSGAAGFGVGATSSTDLSATYGDAVTMVGGAGKTLDSFQFAVFCSSSSAANLVSATGTIRFFRASDNSPIGAFSVNLGALPRGFFSLYNVTSLAALNINFDTNDIIIRQQLSNVVGATRMGTVFSNASNTPAVGTTPPGLFIQTATVAPGFYTFSGFATFSSAVYEVGVIPARRRR